MNIFNKKKEQTRYEKALDLLVTSERKLKKPCVEADDLVEAMQIGRHLQKVAQDLDSSKRMGCVGLAANQLGYDKRVIVIKKNGRFKILINPIIVAGMGSITHKETCFSRLNKEPVEVTRMTMIIIKADNSMKAQLKRMEAYAYQHEIDHLNGILI